MTLLTEAASRDPAALSGALGAEIFGVDLAEPARRRDRARAPRSALLEHIVIFFRDQELSPPQLLALAERFGEPAEYPLIKGLPECPLVLPIIKEPQERANFGGIWHSDTAYLERPALGTLLYALETPPAGGDTLFANMYLAYETLSDGHAAPARGAARRSMSPASRSPSRPARRCTQARHGGRSRSDQRGAPGRAHPPRDRTQGALRQLRAHAPLRGHDRGRERAAARLICSPTRSSPSSPAASAGGPARSRSGTTARASTIP